MNIKLLLQSILFFITLLVSYQTAVAQEQPSPYSIKLYTQSGIAAAKEAEAAEDVGVLFSKINEDKAALNKMRLEVRQLQKEPQQAVLLRIRETEAELRERFEQLLAFILEKQSGSDTDPLITRNAKSLMVEESEIIRSEIEYVKNTITNLQQGFNALDDEQVYARTQDIARKYERYDGLLEDLLENANRLKSLKIPAENDLRLLDKLLHERALTVSGEIKLNLEQLSALKEQYHNAAAREKAEIQSTITTTEGRKKASTNSLTSLIVLMNTRGMETTEYSKLLLRSTGQISSEILNKAVAVSLLNSWYEFVKNWLQKNGIAITLKVVVVIVILLIFKLIANLVKRLVKRTIGREESSFSNLMGHFLVSISGKLVMIIGILVALSQLGMRVAPLLAGLGIAGFIVGFALQDVLSNFASGVMILIYQPFDVGDLIEVPEARGHVRHMNLVSTTILTSDNQKLVVPNNKIWGNIIRNVHSEPIRRVDMSFGVGYESDLRTVETVLKEILDTHEMILAHPTPQIKVHMLNQSSVDFIVRPWTKTAHYWDVYWDITRTVKKRFDEAGISIPYPQQDIHIKNNKSEKP